MNKDVVVVDANIAVKLVIIEEDSPLAKHLFKEWADQNKLVLAPDLFLYEMANILWKKVRQDKMLLTEVKEILSVMLDMGIEIYWPLDSRLSLNAFELAYTHKLPATYDAHYLALAEREQCEFWTADERLYNSVKGQLPWVRLMTDPATSAVSA